MNWLDWTTGLALGVGLSAACGLRVFVPLLIASLAGLSGWLPLGEGFQWLATRPALVVLAVATVLEMLAYQIPGLDHALDTLAGPAAVVAGTLLTASQLETLDPLLKWSLALIAGGGAAGLVQGVTTTARAVSGVTTGGLGNPFLAAAESVGATVAAAGSVWLPVVGLAVLVAFAGLAGMMIGMRRRRRHRPPPLRSPSKPKPASR